MEQKAYLRIYEPEGGLPYGDFSLFLPAGDAYAEYRFVYEQDAIKPDLPFNKGPNDPANRSFYRIKTAWIVRQDGEWFVPMFRALQSGEIGLALREQGAGDFVGGLHGDENLTAVSLWLGDRQLPLDEPFFGCADGFRFVESSKISRCNTPDVILMLHDQVYTLEGNTLKLSQSVKWVNDALDIQSAFMPMLTVQRLNPANTSQILTDTVELYAPDGTLAGSFDTTPYGTVGNPNAKGDDTIPALKNTYATSAKVYGKNGGLCVEGGYTVLEDSIPKEQICTNLLIRFMPHTYDNKIYFRICAGQGPKAGTHWKSDVFYRITYRK